MTEHVPCTLVARPNLFASERVFTQVPAGQTLAQMLGEDAAWSLRVEIGGYEVPRALWGQVRPKPGVLIHATIYPQGGNGGKLLRVVAIAVLAYFTLGAGGALAANGGWLGAAGITGAGASALYAGTFLLGSMAINALIPPPTAKGLGSTGDPFQQLASLTGTSNHANPGGVIPCVVGNMRFYPPHAALPYTEISGDEQYLRMLLDLGLETTPGSLDISNIEIGGTPIANYSDVAWEVSTAPTLFTQDIYELGVSAALNVLNDTALRTTQAASTEISLDIVFGQGLFGVSDQGATVTGTVVFSVQYRPTGSTTWLDVGTATGLTLTGGMVLVSGSQVQVSSAVRKTLRAGIRWTVAAGQYDVQVTRGGSTFTGASANGQIGSAVWSVLRSISPQNPSTTGTLKLAVRIKATDQLQGVVQNLSVLAAQKIRQWDTATSSWLAPVATTNPAWIYLWMLTQCPAVVRPLADTRVDVAGIADWAAECAAKGFAIGFVMDSPRAHGDWLRDILAAGRATFGLRNSQYSAVRDIAQSVPVQVFTPANSHSLSYSRAFLDLPHALRVKFTNPQANYQQDEVIAYADGYTAATATRFEALDLSMVIDPGAAWRLGRYHLAAAADRPTTYTLQADVEHIVCERGDLVQVSHDIVGYGSDWGRIKAITTTTVTLDSAVTLATGKSYGIRARDSAGNQLTTTVSSATLDTPVTILTLGAALTGVAAGDLFMVGEAGTVSMALLVKSVEPSADLSAMITLVDAAPAVLTADSGTPPTFVSSITGTAWCAAPPPPVVHIRAGDSAPDNAGVIKAQTGVSSQPSGGLYRFPPPTAGGGCVVVDSLLPDMRRAGEVAVGDMLAMADQDSLADRQGRVTYSEAKQQPCVELVTCSGIVLRCSTSAPIPTPEGLVLAPQLAGRCVAVRDGQGTRWEAITHISALGERWVQHISVDDGCFWAGAEPGRYVLHHNKLASMPANSMIARR